MKASFAIAGLLSAIASFAILCGAATLQAQTPAPAQAAAAQTNSLASMLINSTFIIRSPNASSACFALGRKQPGGAQAGELFIIAPASFISSVKESEAWLVLRKPTPEGLMADSIVSLPMRDQNGASLWQKHSREDIAALYAPWLSSSLPAGSVIPDKDYLASEADLQGLAISQGDNVNAICFPYWLASASQSLASQPIQRQGSLASSSLTPLNANPAFLLNFPLYPPASGEPVFLDEYSRFASGAKLLSDGKILGMVQGTLPNAVSIPSASAAAQANAKTSLAIQAPFIRELIDSIQVQAQPPAAVQATFPPVASATVFPIYESATYVSWTVTDWSYSFWTGPALGYVNPWWSQLHDWDRRRPDWGHKPPQPPWKPRPPNNLVQVPKNTIPDRPDHPDKPKAPHTEKPDAPKPQRPMPTLPARPEKPDSPKPVRPDLALPVKPEQPKDDQAAQQRHLEQKEKQRQIDMQQMQELQRKDQLQQQRERQRQAELQQERQRQIEAQQQELQRKEQVQRLQEQQERQKQVKTQQQEKQQHLDVQQQELQRKEQVQRLQEQQERQKQVKTQQQEKQQHLDVQQQEERQRLSELQRQQQMQQQIQAQQQERQRQVDLRQQQVKTPPAQQQKTTPRPERAQPQPDVLPQLPPSQTAGDSPLKSSDSTSTALPSTRRSR